MDYVAFLNDVRAQAGLAPEDATEPLAHAVLEVLGGTLVAGDRHAVAQRLPASIAGALGRGDAVTEVITHADAFFEAVAAHEHVSAGFGREHTHVVCRLIAQALDNDTLTFLVRRLPDDIAELFERRAPSPPPPRPMRVRTPRPGQGHSLSDGRPGSSNPISEARGGTHLHSVLLADDPHADTKLSSSKKG